MSRARDTADQINRVNSSAADATAVTVDSSENVLINGTSTTPWSLSSGSGAVIRSEGYAGFASSSAAIELNRIGSDGNIANFRKDGTSVGSIQSRGGTVSTLILDPRTNGGGLTGTANAVMPTSNAGVIGDSNTSLDLGASGYAFRNAYLSGGIYLGGTGSANYLEDYEEGTHAATFGMNGSGSISMLRQNIGYAKVGRLVTITGEVAVSSVSSPVGSMTMTLPFTISANGSGRDTFFGAKPVAYRVPHNQDNTPIILGNTANAFVTFVYEQDNAPFADFTPAANATFNMSFSYLTSA